MLDGGFGQGDRFLRAMASIETAADLSELMRAIASLPECYGLKHAAFFGFGRPDSALLQDTVLVTYPVDWVDHYIRRRYHEIDPVMRIGAQSIVPVDWDALDKSNPAVRRFFGEAEEAGVGTKGMVLPSRGPGGAQALFAVSCDLPDGDWRALRPDLMRDMQVIANLLHSRVIAFQAVAAPSGTRRLSARERETLQWAAAGKTIDQTATILDLSPSAVRTYLDAARRKLNCLTKPQAVAVGVRLGLIDG